MKKRYLPIIVFLLVFAGLQGQTIKDTDLLKEKLESINNQIADSFCIMTAVLF